MKNVYTSIDIGTDTIKVAVCQLFNNKLNLLAASSVKTEGIKKGLIVNSQLVKEKIEEAIGEVEEMLGVSLKKAIVSISSHNAEFKLINGKTTINEDVGVLGKDIARVLDNAITNEPLLDREVVNVLPIDFGIDDEKCILDPKGKTGKVLTVRTVIATIPKKNIYSVVSLLENLGLEVVDVSLNSIGDINIFKNKTTEEKI